MPPPDAERFVWPPAIPPDQPAPHPPEPHPPPPRAEHKPPLWPVIERALLMPTAEPFPRRAAAVGWCPDPPGAYCDRCGRTTAPSEILEFGCSGCEGTRPPWQRFVRLGPYRDDLGLWIREIKFTRFHALAHAIGRELGRAAVRAGAVDAAKAINAPIAVVPVPTPFRRRMERGIDHPRAIALGVAAEVGAPVVAALARSDRPSQRSVPASRRTANVAGAFRTRRASRRTAGALVLLVDDVLTSGATLRAAARTLRRTRSDPLRPAGVWACVAGVTPEPGRRDPARALAEHENDVLLVDNLRATAKD